MTGQLGSSGWTVAEARGVIAQLRHVATEGPEYDGVELFLALCEYLDQLYGGHGFDVLLVDQGLAGAIREQRSRRAGAGERLEQPVNSAVTLVEGRALAGALESAAGWQHQLGLALQALYTYLDQLYGGPGAFTELLTSEERNRVASR